MSDVLKLKKSNCKNCHKCIRHCPVKSIRFSGNQAHIMSDECILCGQCFVVCPQNAKEIADGIEVSKLLLSGDAPVVASIAPSFAAYFDGVGLDAMTDALKQLNFASVEETAIGATFVKREYEKQINSGKEDIIISSCCHSVNLLIRKYFPELIKYLSPVVSPMIAHSLDIKKRIPGAKTIFIGPCLSKKDEAINSPVDAVLTFEELSHMMADANIVPEKKICHTEESRTRIFPTVGGIIKSMFIPEESDYTYITVDGVENCISSLNDIKGGNIHNCFIEMSACAGSCIGGPVMEKYSNAPLRHYQSVTKFAGKRDFNVSPMDTDTLRCEHTYLAVNKRTPSEDEINAILKKMGKNSPSDELNCGSCGYNTCREKAIAVIQGKADISMCLPYLMEKTERFSNTILANTPNGILVVNENFEIQQLNRAAMYMLNIKNTSDVLGEQVVCILNPEPFIDVLAGKTVRGRLEYYAEFDKYIELSIIHDKTTHIFIALMRDVTDETVARRHEDEIRQQTVEIADNVVEKQMRIVQEIASLLGETAAETKIALTKLKESISHEDENQ